jgi:hypothetical protein
VAVYLTYVIAKTGHGNRALVTRNSALRPIGILAKGDEDDPLFLG